MFWWLLALAISILLFVWRWHLPARKHPSHFLGKQAASMGWVASGIASDPKGYMNMKVTRAGMEAVIVYSEEHVRLLHPPVERPFKDFVEVERWLEQQ